MGEITTLSSPTKRQISSSLLFTQSPMSPTSTLDSIFNKNDTKTTKRQWTKPDSIGIGIAIVDDPTRFSKPETRMVLFGSRLKIQIPPISYGSDDISATKSADFGIRTKNPHVGFFSARNNSGFGSGSGCSSGSISVTEMELSEDYTCVITHGPNPKTTHIFDNCVVQSCCGVVSDTKIEYKNNNNISIINGNNCFESVGDDLSLENFLSFCYTCKRNLGHGKDIYMYRGEKAFCSKECRYEEMMMEEREVDEIVI